MISGAPFCRGNGSSRLFLSENTTENANVDDKKQSQESNNTGNKNTRSHNHAIRKITGSFENKLNEIDPSITNKSSRNASIDSAEDSGDWDDLEIPRLMPELTAIDEHLNEHRIQFPVINEFIKQKSALWFLYNLFISLILKWFYRFRLMIAHHHLSNLYQNHLPRKAHLVLD